MINLSNTLKKKNNKKGFTLIELIVVIAILGILAAIAIPRFSGVNERARKSADDGTVQTLQAAVRVYEAEKGALPAAADADTQAKWETAFGPYINGGKVPAPRQVGFTFKYDTSTGVITCTSAAAAGNVFVISAAGAN